MASHLPNLDGRQPRRVTREGIDALRRRGASAELLACVEAALHHQKRRGQRRRLWARLAATVGR